MDQVGEYALMFVKWASAFVVAQMAAATVGPRAVITGLVFLMAVDWITGFTAAWINGTASSEVGAKGFAKKGIILLLILTIHVAEKLCGYELNLEVWGAAGYCFNELVSIVENVARVGVYIPKPLIDGLLKIKAVSPGNASKADLDKLRDERKISFSESSEIVKTPASQPDIKVDKTTTILEEQHVTRVVPPKE